MEIYTLTLTFCLASFLLVAYVTSSNWVASLTIFLSCISLTLCLGYLVISYFSDGGLNTAALNHLHYALDPDTLLKFWKVASATFLTLILIVFGALLARRYLVGTLNNSSSGINLVAGLFSLAVAALSLYFNPITIDGIKLYQDHAYTERTKLPQNFDSVSEIAPSLAASPPRQKNDFILIFAEGYESAFLDESLYPGLTPKLNTLIDKWGVRIRGIRDLVLTNWTQGGMSAATCGLPMLPEYSDGDNVSLSSTYLIGESCTGDILSRDGYQLHFYGGSQFGGEDKYRLFQHQGYSKVMIQKEFDQVLEQGTPTSSWGYYDASVLDYAADQFLTSSSNSGAKKPRGFVVLTLDSHQPGLPSPECASQPYQDGNDPILNGVHCDDTLITAFINKILDNPATKNTTILLVSDHLHAKPPMALSQIPRSMRDYLFVAFNAHPKAGLSGEVTRDATALDIAPTLLAILGYEIGGFNLGRNLLKGDKTLVESLGRETMFANIANMRAAIREHWKKGDPQIGKEQPSR